jgi:hypothetical protein
MPKIIDIKDDHGLLATCISGHWADFRPVLNTRSTYQSIWVDGQLVLMVNLLDKTILIDRLAEFFPQLSPKVNF